MDNEFYAVIDTNVIVSAMLSSNPASNPAKVFKAVLLSREDAYLVTGNLKHFPKRPRVLSPAEMVILLG